MPSVALALTLFSALAAAQTPPEAAAPIDPASGGAPQVQVLSLANGTLTERLLEAGVPLDDVSRVVAPLARYIEQSGLPLGDTVELDLAPGAAGTELRELRLSPDPQTTLAVTYAEGQASIRVLTAPVLSDAAAALAIVPDEGVPVAAAPDPALAAAADTAPPVAAPADADPLVAELADEAVLAEDEPDAGWSAAVSIDLGPAFQGPDPARPDSRDQAGTMPSELLVPVVGARVTSRFGARRGGAHRVHKGVDLAAPEGTPVYAAAAGQVLFAGRDGAYGKIIRIEHGAAVETGYAHLSRIAPGLEAGDFVEQGEVIGYVGRTGSATGAHLHFEMVVNGGHVDPLTRTVAIELDPRGEQVAHMPLDLAPPHRAVGF